MSTHRLSESAPLIELDRATVCRGLTPALHNLSLCIHQGQHTAILGPNGCGKSTFVKLINRELYPIARQGEAPVRVLGKTRWDVFELREQLGVVTPDLQRDLSAAQGLGVEDAVACGYFAAQRPPLHRQVTAAMRERALEALAEADATHLARRALVSLSSGEARRVLIARALVHRPQALLLDEPTTGLDVAAQHRFLMTLRKLARGGTTLVLVTHHIEEIIDEIERVILLRDGSVFADGAPDEVLTSQRMSTLYGLPLHVERGTGHYRLVPARQHPVQHSDTKLV